MRRWMSRNRPLRWYEDIRQKLIAKGVPAEQIAFIHEANTEVRKKELFSKVRTGQVRVLLGSTKRWAQAPTSRGTAWWRSMTWTAPGGPATWPSGKAELNDRATKMMDGPCVPLRHRRDI